MISDVLSNRAKALKPSPTLAMAARARELQAQGHDVVNLTVGEPDWATFKSANEAGIKAIQDGFTKYTAAAGIIELRQEIANQTEKFIGVNYKPSECVVGAGAKYVIYAALQMIINPGDEVIIPSPYWVSYPTMVELAGGKNVFITTEKDSHFKLTAQQLENSITAKTKALILCSPSNPTGVQYSSEELRKIAEVLRRHSHVILISDDIYNRLNFSTTNPPEACSPHILQVAPDLKKQVFIVNGVSKTYSMTGWRLGWGLGPSEIINPLADYLSQTTSNVSSITQKAALAALQNGEAELSTAKQNLINRYNLLSAKLKQISGLEVIEPDGAFYIWAGVKQWLGKTHKPSGKKLNNSKDVSEALLDSCYLATVPGIEFGTEGYLRMSFAASQATLEKAADRLLIFSQQLG
jgi:aspartate aminotransferase